jgi:predicted nucleic acid-binding Zn ribbon protein
MPMTARPPKYFYKKRASGLTSVSIKDMLPSFLGKLGKNFHERKDLLLASWPDLVGPRIAKMTRVDSLYEGVLYVKVSNSTLHSLLKQSEKSAIIRKIKQRFPKITLTDIKFRIG